MATNSSASGAALGHVAGARARIVAEARALSVSAFRRGAGHDGVGHRTDIALLLGRFGTGGVERVGCLLQNGFTEHGLSAEVVVASRNGPLASLLDANIRVAEIGAGRYAGRRGMALLLSLPALVRHLRRTRPKVLLSPGNHTNVVAALAHRFAGRDTRLVLKITNPVLKERHGAVEAWLRKAFYRWAFGRSDRILVLSRHGERQIAEISRAAAAKTIFVHNPYVAIPDGPQPAAAPAAVPTILSVGRLTAQKNHALLLRALARLLHIEWKLVLLGEGPLERQLRALAEDLGIAGRVEFRGFVADPSPFYREAHLLALSSDWEDLPAVVLEALAVALPVVATACSHALADVMREAAHGRLVPTGDEEAFARALEQLIVEPPQRTPFAGARRYSIENGINDHLAALQPLLR